MLIDIIKGYIATKDLSRRIYNRVGELEAKGYNGRHISQFDYISPLVRELGGDVEAIYEAKENSRSFRLGYGIHRWLADWIGPVKPFPYNLYDIETIHRDRQGVIDFDSEMGTLLNRISNGVKELVETLPEDLRTQVKAKTKEISRSASRIQGTRVYQTGDISPISSN